MFPAMRQHIMAHTGSSSLEDVMSDWETGSSETRGGVDQWHLSTWAAQGNFLWNYK
jgi:hypothetical protein